MARHSFNCDRANLWLTRSLPAIAGCIPPSSFSVPRALHPEPVEQRALGLLLAGCDFDQALDERGSAWVGALSLVVGPTYGLTCSHAQPRTILSRLFATLGLMPTPCPLTCRRMVKNERDQESILPYRADVKKQMLSFGVMNSIVAQTTDKNLLFGAPACT